MYDQERRGHLSIRCGNGSAVGSSGIVGALEPGEKKSQLGVAVLGT